MLEQIVANSGTGTGEQIESQPSTQVPEQVSVGQPEQIGQQESNPINADALMAANARLAA